jgi:hypothetical protein
LAKSLCDIFQEKTVKHSDDSPGTDRESLKAELDFLDDLFLHELKEIEEIEETDTFQREQTWIELREVDGQLDFLKGRGIVFYSRDEVLEYSS